VLLLEVKGAPRLATTWQKVLAPTDMLQTGAEVASVVS
jgi:hypothetical protein